MKDQTCIDISKGYLNFHKNLSINLLISHSLLGY